MPRDYANKPKKRTNATRFKEQRKQPTDNGAIGMLIGLALGIVLTVVVGYYYFTSGNDTTEITQLKQPAESVKQPPSAKTRYQAVPAEEVEESEFSFHDELENKTVEVDAPELPPNQTESNRLWVMQCASFQKISSAENMKARIAMVGFSADIKSSQNEAGTTWYRVVLGPYKSKRQAERDRHELERNDINTCRIW